eukprot:Selendium_serpulae@DN5043_c0_g1_i2.p1
MIKKIVILLVSLLVAADAAGLIGATGGFPSPYATLNGGGATGYLAGVPGAYAAPAAARGCTENRLMAAAVAYQRHIRATNGVGYRSGYSTGYGCGPARLLREIESCYGQVSS